MKKCGNIFGISIAYAVLIFALNTTNASADCPYTGTKPSVGAISCNNGSGWTCDQANKYYYLGVKCYLLGDNASMTASGIGYTCKDGYYMTGMGSPCQSLPIGASPKTAQQGYGYSCNNDRFSITSNGKPVCGKVPTNGGATKDSVTGSFFTCNERNSDNNGYKYYASTDSNGDGVCIALPANAMTGGLQQTNLRWGYKCNSGYSKSGGDSNPQCTRN
jgi:hypothetical protein